MDTVDDAIERVYKYSFKLGMMDGAAKQTPFKQFGAQSVDTPQHRQLALEAAQQAIILLQNNNTGGAGGKPLLPLPKTAKIALIGPHLNSTR